MGQVAFRGPSFDRQAVHRIHIIGGAGSGKTTLACQVAARLDIPVYFLDEIYYGSDIYFKNAGQAHRSLDTLLADVTRTPAQSACVTDGTYLGWTEKLLCRADMIILLDIT